MPSSPQKLSPSAGIVHVTKDAGYKLEGNLSLVALKSSGPNAKREISRYRQLAQGAVQGTDRLPFEHDRDRIIHCRQFRKLAGKTQLLIRPNRGDLRTRLTHTMEVYQLATYFGRRLNLNIPAVEAIALGHDTGHTPFGHAGEAALNELLSDFGGFHHAAHSVRSLDRVAYDPHTLQEEDTSGLNLTWAVREGIFKHGWYSSPSTPYHKPPLSTLEWDLDSYRSHGSAEAQAVALADQIAYLNHDLDDLLLYGFDKILSPKIIAAFFATQTAKSRAPGTYSDWNATAQQFLTLLKLDEPNRVKYLVRDAVDASVKRVEQVVAGNLNPTKERLIEFSPAYRDTRNLFYAFFNECVYNDVRIQHKNKKGKDIIFFLYDFFERFYNGNRDLLPMHIQDELAANPPWWETYLAALVSKRSKHATRKPALIDNGAIACKFAAADVVADLTDNEALTAARALEETESTAGMEVVDRVLATFPNRQQFDRKQRRQHETRQELRALFPVAGN